MFKLYKWLVYINIRPYKKLQHFRNWFAILFSRTKTNTEKKIEKKRQRSYLSHWAKPTSFWPNPAHQGHPRLLPPLARSSSVAARARTGATSAPRSPWSPRVHSLVSWRTTYAPCTDSPPSQCLSTPLSSSQAHPREQPQAMAMATRSPSQP